MTKMVLTLYSGFRVKHGMTKYGHRVTKNGSEEWQK